MKQKQDIPATLVVTCNKCGRKERVSITDMSEYVYQDDIMRELGWNRGTCSTCQELDKIEKKRR